MNDPFDLGNDAPPTQEHSAVSVPPLSAQASQAVQARKLAPLLDGLNDAQREAVLADDGPLLLLAGAGTGKTRALTTRIAYKIATQQIWPSQVLAVTFTNKAAREMKDRISRMLGESIEGMPWLGTFHSLSARILRQHAELVGLRPDFTILDTDDQIRLLKQIIKAENIDEKRWPARQMAILIDRWKNRGLKPDDVPQDQAESFADGRAGMIYATYQKRLKILNAVDFGDLLLETLRLFQENHEVLAQYQQKFKNILVDEYQDTNVAQYLWLRLLAQGHSNICCVGDDDQSIYGWRGAEVDNILRFEKDFIGARVIKLECNYRSTPHILGAASGLIAANKGRLGKTLWTERNDGEKIMLRGTWDSKEEARQTADDVETRQRAGDKLNEIAILVRASFQMREFEDCFIKLGIPYRVIGGPRFYERAEIRDANAYLRLIIQPDDDLAFERICNKPRRGLGAVTLNILHSQARQHGQSLYRTAQAIITSDALKPQARRALAGFVQDMLRWREQVETMPHTELAELVLDESGYTQMLQNDKSPDAPGKLENLKELVRLIDEQKNLHAHLEDVSLAIKVQNDDDTDMVSLMTLHAAKGLEFDTVFLPGWEEGLFPYQRSLDENGTKGLEEERRLAYVGLTRARQRATISFIGNRNIHGQWVSPSPSRFIDELPAEHVEVAGNDDVANGDGAIFEQGAHFDQSAMRRHTRHQPPIIDGDGLPISSVSEMEQAMEHKSQYQIGERVFHQKFGYGKIQEIDRNKLNIAFEKAGAKKVLDDYVEKV